MKIRNITITLLGLFLVYGLFFVTSGRVYADNANPPGFGTSAADDNAEADVAAACPGAMAKDPKLHTIHIIYPDPAVSTVSNELTFSLKAAARVCDRVNRYNVHQ